MGTKNILTPTLNLDEMAERGIDPKAVRFLLHLLQCERRNHGGLLIKDPHWRDGHGMWHSNFASNFNLFASEQLGRVRNRKDQNSERRERLSLEGTPIAVNVETSRGPVTLRLQQLWFEPDPYCSEADERVTTHEVRRFVNLHVARRLRLLPVTREELEALVKKEAAEYRIRYRDDRYYLNQAFITTGPTQALSIVGGDKVAHIGDVRTSDPHPHRWEKSETRQVDSEPYNETSFYTDRLWAVGK